MVVHLRLSYRADGRSGKKKEESQHEIPDLAFHRLGIILFEIAQSGIDEAAHRCQGKKQGNLQYQNGKGVINTAKMNTRRKIEPLPRQ
jgi:hypothetical protein